MDCRYCGWYYVKGCWSTQCKNENSEYYGENCVEKDVYEPSWCDDKEEKE